MRPRLHLIVDLLTLQDHLNDIVKDLPETSNLRQTFQRWVIDCLQYLYSGIGDFNKIQQDFQKIAEQARDQKDISTNLRDISSKTFAVFNNFFNDSKEHPLRNLSDNGFNRLSDMEVKLLTQWQDHFSQRLLQVKETVFRESIHYYLVVVDGQLNTPEVKQHLKEAHISPNWLENQTNFRNISDAILSALKIIPTAEQKEIEISLDLKTLNQKIKQLVKEHFVQEREYKIGVLAVLNFLFQTDKDKDGNKKIINENWANQEGFKIRMSQFTSAENDNLIALKNSMQRGISSSLTQTNKYLPWVEGALCVAGLVVGGVGSGFKERASIVTGSTVTGVGCGAFLTHFIYPSRNPYIADSIGGAILGTAAFLSSFLLTGAYLKPNMMPPPPNMMMPPPLDPNSRNPVSGWGP